MRTRLLTVGAGLFAVFVLAVAGCQPEDKTTPTKGRDGYGYESGDGPNGADPNRQANKGADPNRQANKSNHSGWWCSEHGIPEDDCLMCKMSEESLKKKGDWCEKHEFAKSQCFKCNPKLREKYAAVYRAKYGKEPPPIEDDEAE